MTAGNLESKIRELNREILRLKTSHPIASNMITFYGIYAWAGGERTYEITYVEGNQPIMTWVLFSKLSSTGYILLREPVGNKQIMIDELGNGQGETYALLSTRQILGVRLIS